MRKVSCSIRMPDSATPWWPGSRSSSCAPRSRSSASRGAAWLCAGRASALRPAGLLAVLEEGGVLAFRSSGTAGAGSTCWGPRTCSSTRQPEPRPRGSSPVTRDAVEACRIVSGIPAMGSELTDRTIAAEAGLVDRSVSFTKGCYTGQELVARLDARGNNVPRRLVGCDRRPDPALGDRARTPADDPARAPDRSTSAGHERQGGGHRSRPQPGAPSWGRGSPWPTCTGRWTHRSRAGAFG